MRPALMLLLLLSAFTAEARDPAQVRAFRATHPCPSTGLTTGACPNYVVNHIKPLCFSGADDPSNMEWELYADSLKRDAFEREVCALAKRCPK